VGALLVEARGCGARVDGSVARVGVGAGWRTVLG
jgi:hypothetical protein